MGGDVTATQVSLASTAMDPAEAFPAVIRAQLERGMHDARGTRSNMMASGANTAAMYQAGRWKTPVVPAHHAEHLAASCGAVARYHQGRGG